jgi:hypothetical protein
MVEITTSRFRLYNLKKDLRLEKNGTWKESEQNVQSEQLFGV